MKSMQIKNKCFSLGFHANIKILTALLSSLSFFAMAVEQQLAPEISTLETQEAKSTSAATKLSPDIEKSLSFEKKLPLYKSLVTEKAMAVTANPYATQAATEVLQAGGTAIDAAIAAQLVLGLVEPQSSGIGGGAFLLYWDANNKKIISWDGRETAPAAIDETWFLDEHNQPMKFFDAVVGGKAVGVPGVVAMLEQAHREHGRLEWSRLFDSAINLSQQGFVVSHRLNQLLENLYGPEAEGEFKQLYFPGGKALKEGDVFKNSAYAETLKKLSTDGADYFYQGELAESIAAAVQAQKRPGKLTVNDLKNYQAKKREALCMPYLQFEVCGMGPPSSGGFTVASILGVMQSYLSDSKNFQTAADNKNSVGNQAHAFMEASKLAFADRNQYLADTDFVEVPFKQLLNKNYLQQRANLIQADSSFDKAQPGWVKTATEEKNPELPSTTHLSIVDQYGNVLSMTSSIEMAFGSRVVVDGFILNNQLTDFSFSPVAKNISVGAKSPVAKNISVEEKSPDENVKNRKKQSSNGKSSTDKSSKDSSNTDTSRKYPSNKEQVNTELSEQKRSGKEQNKPEASKAKENRATFVSIANRVQPNKRPRSSMAPTIVLKNNKPYLAIGSPGGSRIIDFVARSLFLILAENRDIQSAINQPHWIAMNNGRVEVGVEDKNIQLDELIQALQSKGQTVKAASHSSGLHVIKISEQGLYGAADKRREGTVSGF